MPLDPPTPPTPVVVHAATQSGGTVLVLDFNVPMVQDTPSAGNVMRWNVSPVSRQSCTGPTAAYAWNSPTQVAIAANGTLVGAALNTCMWSPDVGSATRLRSVQGVYLDAFTGFPIT